MEENFTARAKELDTLLGVGRSFDMVGRDLEIGSCRARLWLVNGYADELLLERIIAIWQALPPETEFSDPESFVRRCVSSCDAQVERDRDRAVTAVFAGKTLLIMDGFYGGILLEAKQFPLRSVSEPDTSRVLRGSHDGFLENIIKNAALLRRRIRSPQLILEHLQIAGHSAADVVLCYMEGKADSTLVEELRRKIAAVDVRSLSMSQESLAEAISPRQWYNPFPKVRYTERPDVATASIMEGDVLVMVDNSPAVMILPVSLFRFCEEINDYYFPPLVGSYLRLTRLLILLLTVFLMPLWYLLVKSPESVPPALQFLIIEGPVHVPLIVQLLLVEFVVDMLKLASLNTPNVLSNSFSMLGALMLGDFAVQSRWLVPEVLVYMAFVAIANYTQHSYELGYACKFCRVTLLLLCWALDWWGFALGTVLILLMVATTRPIAGRSYLYPLIPFDKKALKALMHRRPVSRDNT